MTTFLPRIPKRPFKDPMPTGINRREYAAKQVLKPDYDETLMDETQFIQDGKRKRGHNDKDGPRPCHKHGKVNCTLDKCPLPEGYGYLGFRATSDSNKRSKVWYSDHRIARMYCCICDETGDHWDYHCPEYIPPWVTIPSINPTDDSCAGGPQCDQDCNAERPSFGECDNICEGVDSGSIG